MFGYKKVLVTQFRLTLCDPIDCSTLGSSVHGILHALILEWVAIPFSKGPFWPKDQTLVSCIAGSLNHWEWNHIPCLELWIRGEGVKIVYATWSMEIYMILYL